MIYLLMCGGSYPHWQEPKHLQKIHGEPIVARTIRLLRENGIENIAITSNDERFKQFGVPVLEHDNTYVYGKVHTWLDAFYPLDGTERPVNVAITTFRIMRLTAAAIIFLSTIAVGLALRGRPARCA